MLCIWDTTREAFTVLSTPHGALGTLSAKRVGEEITDLSTPHGALGTMVL